MDEKKLQQEERHIETEHIMKRDKEREEQLQQIEQKRKQESPFLFPVLHFRYEI